MQPDLTHLSGEEPKASHPRIIDYATNGMRDDFMDIYLGAKCEFCISTCAGWDAIPIIFRRPIVFVNLVTLAQLVIFRIPYYFIPKRLYSEPNDRELTLREVFSSGASSYGYSQDYINNEITLINNTSEEIRDIVVEVEERLRGAWHTSDDDDLQRKFWNIVPTSMNNDDGNPFYGQIRGKIGSLYLRNNPEYLR